MQNNAKTVQIRSESASLVAQLKELPHENPIRCSHYVQKYKPWSGLHYHDCLELGRCTAGSGVMLIDGRTYSFGAGSVSIIPCGCIHSSHISMQPGEAGSVWEFVFADVAAMGIRGGDMGGFVTDGGEMASLFGFLFAETETRPIRWEERAVHLLSAMLLSAERNAPVAVGHSDLSSEAMVCALRRISLSYDQPLRVPDLAAECGMSVSTFNRMFQRAVHMSPLAYITSVRLSVAHRLLLYTEKSILAVAGETGFPTLSSFNRSFKKRFGVTPREMRR